MIGSSTIENSNVVRKQKPTSESVNHNFQEQTTFVANKLYRPELLKERVYSSAKLQEQLYLHILIRMLKTSDTIYWEIRNQFQYKN